MIAIGNDRRGMKYKRIITEYLIKKGINVMNVGSDDDLPSDYPVYAQKVADAVVSGECQQGILICGSGVGMSIAANKVQGIRCGLAYNPQIARMIREHNDANVMALGADYLSAEDVLKCVDIFINTDFAGAHHFTRIQQIADIENGLFIKA